MFTPPLRILRGHGDERSPRRQRRSEVVKIAVVANQRHFVSIHHYPGTGLGFAGHLDHMAVLDQGIDFEVNRDRVLALGNDRETVLLAFHGFFPLASRDLDHPVIRSFRPRLVTVTSAVVTTLRSTMVEEK